LTDAALIFDGVSTNQDGPLGIQVTPEATGSWAWYGSGWAPRLVGSGYTCNAVYWTMELPHVTMFTSFSGDIGICEYTSGYYDIATYSIGINGYLVNGQNSFTNTGLYAQRGCGGPCCSIGNTCGGELDNLVNVATTNAAGEVQLMVNQLLAVGPKYTGPSPCSCTNGGSRFPCPANPLPGVYTPQNGRVDLVYGPFTDSTGRHPVNPHGTAPYIQYTLVEEPPNACQGAVLNTFLTVLEGAVVGLLTSGTLTPAIIAQQVASAGGQIAVLGIECAVS
jgi:hypothetical protein